MIKGLYISKAGMCARARHLDVIANNLANINTTGYKKDKLFYLRMREAQDALNDSASNELAKVEIMTDYSSGELKNTGNPLDLAIVGEGFFVVQTPQGDVYTRDGNFTLDAEGRLTTLDGYPVLGNGGEIQIVGNEIRIGEDGSITVDGEIVDKIRVVTFDDLTQLIKIGGNYFSDEQTNGAIEVSPEKIHIRQGYLENSNVNGIQEIVQMIELYRQFELEKLINDGGRVA